MLKGKAVLITGASTGIGYSLSQALADAGAEVYAGVRSEQDRERLARSHDQIHPVMLDVTDADQIRDAAESISRSVGDKGLSGLVNNAGCAIACPLEFLPLDRFKNQFEVNLFGQLAVTQAMLPLLRNAKGRIVNVTSLSGHLAGPYVGPYAASKHAFSAMNDSMRLELRKFGIKVIEVIPGDIKTPIWKKSRSSADQLRDEIAEDIVQSLPDSVRDVYATDAEVMRKATDGFAQKALPVEQVTRCITKSLTDKTPRAKYTIGFRAWGAVHLLKKIPVGLRDRIVLRNLGMKP